jgi:hypothetical protein
MGLPLVTAAEYKAYAGISSTNQDAEIAAIIPIASQLVKSICGSTFVDYVNDSNEEIFSGGWPKLYLTEGPLISVSSVEYSTDFGNTYTSLTEFTDYAVDREDNSICSTSRDSRGYILEFPKYVNGYKVTYYAGYETLPSDLKVAALDLVTYYLKHEGSVHSPKAPGTNTVQIEYITNVRLPAHIARVLDLYTAKFN